MTSMRNHRQRQNLGGWTARRPSQRHLSLSRHVRLVARRFVHRLRPSPGERSSPLWVLTGLAGFNRVRFEYHPLNVGIRSLTPLTRQPTLVPPV